jgi:hypothetical protein
MCIKHEHEWIKGYNGEAICTEHNESIKLAMCEEEEAISITQLDKD